MSLFYACSVRLPGRFGTVCRVEVPPNASPEPRRRTGIPEAPRRTSENMFANSGWRRRRQALLGRGMADDGRASRPSVRDPAPDPLACDRLYGTRSGTGSFRTRPTLRHTIRHRLLSHATIMICSEYVRNMPGYARICPMMSRCRDRPATALRDASGPTHSVRCAAGSIHRSARATARYCRINRAQPTGRASGVTCTQCWAAWHGHYGIYSARLIPGHSCSTNFPRSDAVKRLFKKRIALTRAEYITFIVIGE